MKEEIKIWIEGSEINKAINKIYLEKIPLKRIRYLAETKAEMICLNNDIDRIREILKNKYYIEVLEQKGPETIINKIKNRKTTIIGVILFVAILIYQGMFICRIEINGLETINQNKVMKVLYDNGIYIGCKKNTYDLEAVEFDIFDRVKGISWMELHQKGGVITVDIVEEEKEVKKQEESPVNIIAIKDGYINEVIPERGQRVVDIGQYVKKGDVLISGEIINKIDENLKRYVRADGQVYGKCIYVIERKEPVEIQEEQPTGRFYPGIKFNFGDFELDTCKIIDYFSKKKINEKKIFEIKVPIPISFSVLGINEVENVTKVRNLSEIKRNAEIEILKELKKNIGEKGRIVNKDLQFIEEENIIEARGKFEVIEEIGGEEPIINERTENTD